jgi:hypothetical protein
MRARFAGLATVVLGLWLVPVPAQAQFGDMLKKAAKDKVKEKVAGGAETKPATPATTEKGSRSRSGEAKSPYNSWVLEMTPEVLDRFAVAIVEENRVRDSLVALAKRKPEFERKHAECVQRISQEEKMQGYMNKLGDDKLTQAQKQKAMTDMNDYMVATCGEQHRNPALDAEDALQRGVFTEAAAKAGSFSSKGQYGVVRERILPLCRSGVKAGEGSAQIPGDGTNIFYVYSESEVAALRPRCGEFVKLLAEPA